MNRSSPRFALFLLAGVWAGQALAWGQQGTALIGELAQRQLTPEASAEAGRLLGMIKQSEFAVVANWAGNLDKSEQNKALWEQTRNQRLVVYKSEDCQFQPARDCPDGDCTVAAIERNQTTLADPQAPEQAKLMALLFLIHHVSDAHSPLNNSYRDDKGGYDYPVTVAGKTYNLRQIWDDYLLGSAKLDVKAYADKLQKNLPAAGSNSPSDWSQQSCLIVRNGDIYPKATSSRKLPTKGFGEEGDGFDSNADWNRTGKSYSRGDKLFKDDSGKGDGSIDARYLKKFAPVAEQQVELASVRLARLLNESLVAGRPTAQ
jgi:hypothetical protein